MPTLKIDVGLRPYQGVYELEIDPETPFVALEWRWIKKHSGYGPTTWGQGLVDLDVDLCSILAVIALVRAGKVGETEVYEAVGKFDRLPPFSGKSFTFGATEEVEEEDPPAEPAATPATDEPLRSTGGYGNGTSERSADLLSRTGALA